LIREHFLQFLIRQDQLDLEVLEVPVVPVDLERIAQ
jgi:hypothetical protein